MTEKSTNSKGRTPGLFASLKKVFTMNIGTVMFGILFLYMLFSALLYLTSNHITSYQVISGPLSRNETYTGLALREETVVSADAGGYVTYYAREGNKINANGAVYALSASKSPEVETVLSQEDLAKIRNQMSSFSSGFNPSNFNSTYSFKYELEGNILQYAGVQSASPDITGADGEEDSGSSFSVSTVTLGSQAVSKSLTDGIILYSRDGYEDKTLDTFKAEDFDQNSYQEVDLKTQGQVTAGDDIYTIITDEKWDLVIPLTKKQAVKLADRTIVRVKFLKDSMTQTGDFEIIDRDGAKYGVLSFEKGLIRYASDRFLDIELVTNIQSGLKIPLSAVVTRDFYKIPAEYATMSEDGSEIGFMRQETAKGKDVQVFVPVTIYGRETIAPTEENGEEKYNYYIDKSVFKEGDGIINPDTKEKYIVGKSGKLDGVYCINKGYAVFRCIEVLDQNEEFAIVNDETEYGLVRYDHIVQDASQVKDEDILY